MERIKIKQIRSSIKNLKKQKLTLFALGLRGIGKEVVHKNNPSIMGMVEKVHHLVKVTKIVMKLENLIAIKGSNKELLKGWVEDRVQEKVNIYRRHKGAKSRSGYSKNWVWESNASSKKNSKIWI